MKASLSQKNLQYIAKIYNAIEIAHTRYGEQVAYWLKENKEFVILHNGRDRFFKILKEIGIKANSFENVLRSFINLGFVLDRSKSNGALLKYGRFKLYICP